MACLKGNAARTRDCLLRDVPCDAVFAGLRMMKGFAIASVCMLLASCAPVATNDCAFASEGTFIYLDNVADPSGFYNMRNGRHVEYHQEKQYEIESNVRWINPCEYELELVTTNFQDSRFRRGDKIKMKISNIKGDTIYYTASINESSWNGRVLKVGE